MTKTIHTTIEILGKLYPIRCPESELVSLQTAAAYLNKKMNEVFESGKAINVERIAIISALNIADQYLQADQKKSIFVKKINDKICELQNKIDQAIEKNKQTDLLYAVE